MEREKHVFQGDRVTCHFSLGKVLFKLKIKTKLIVKPLPWGQDAGSVSLSAATTSPTSSSSIISTFLLFFHNYLWVIKEVRVRTIPCSWIYKCATHQRKTFIPENHSFAGDSPGRRRFDVTATEQRHAVLHGSCAGALGKGMLLIGGWLPRCCTHTSNLGQGINQHL